MPVAVPFGSWPDPGPEDRAIEAERPELPASTLDRSASGRSALDRSGLGNPSPLRA